ncbi:MAG: PriCT-2 domain-containing protein [Aliishimia sp.]
MECLKTWRNIANASGHSVREWNAKDEKWWYRPISNPLTDDLIREHLTRGDDCRAIWLNVGNDTDPEKLDHTRFMIFDFDDHNQRMTKDEIFGRVSDVATTLTENEVPHLLFLSGSGHGMHIWVTFDAPKRVDVMKQLADFILKKASLKRKAGGELADGFVEVLPKGVGQQVCAIPFGRNSKRMALTEDGSILETSPQDAFVEQYSGKKRGRKASSESAEENRDAAFDAFAKKYDPDTRDDWGAAGICLQAAFGKENEWARDRWVEWSKTSSAFKQGDEKEWDRLSSASQYTPLSFWRFAEENGYTGKMPFTATEKRKLLALDFLADVRILRDQSDVAYAELKEREWVRIDTNDFRNACALGMLRANQKMPQEQDVKSAQMIAQAQAAEAAPEHVALRFARVGGKRYVFLADPDRTIVEIDDAGWRLNSDAPVQFRRGVGLPMSLPEQGTLDDLVGFLNVDDESMVFLLAWMVTAIINPGQQCPIAILDGSAGSAKSSTLATLIEILDPKVGAMAGEPSSEDDLVVSAYQSAVMSFDNVDTLARLSDALCRLSTGGGLSKRKLYSDGDVFSVDAMRPLLIAGLDPTFYKQDLIERIIRVTLTKPKAYMDEDDFRDYKQANIAKWRGALYSLVSDVLRDVHAVKQSSSRFGVFSRVGECVARRMGRDEGWFGQRYASMRLEMASEAAAADSVYLFLTDFLGGMSQKVGKRWEGTATDLFIDMRAQFADIAQMVSAKDIPANARALSPRIVQASGLIEKTHGWRVSRGPRREFIFEKVADVEASVEDVLAAYRDHVTQTADQAGY